MRIGPIYQPFCIIECTNLLSSGLGQAISLIVDYCENYETAFGLSGIPEQEIIEYHLSNSGRYVEIIHNAIEEAVKAGIFESDDPKDGLRLYKGKNWGKRREVMIQKEWIPAILGLEII